jgi:hypothetical protein
MMDGVIERPTDPAVTAHVRELALALPGAAEKESHGEAAWFVGGRQFATMSDHHHDDRLALWLAAPTGRQESLVETDPSRFFRPPYVGHRGWIGVYLDARTVDWDELAALVADAHALIAAPRRR